MHTLIFLSILNTPCVNGLREGMAVSTIPEGGLTKEEADRLNRGSQKENLIHIIGEVESYEMGKITMFRPIRTV